MQNKLPKKLNIRLAKKHVDQDLHADCYRYRYQAPYLQGLTEKRDNGSRT
jgi:hypothetical protein